MSSRLRKRLKGTALLALLVFLGAFAEAAFFHTDDGCAVEIHCLACRLVLGTTAVAPQPSISVGPGLIDLGAAPQSARAARRRIRHPGGHDPRPSARLEAHSSSTRPRFASAFVFPRWRGKAWLLFKKEWLMSRFIPRVPSKLALITILTLLLAPTAARAAANSGSIRGKVTDPNGNVMPGIVVQLRNDITGFKAEATTAA